jgi:hypothetical protein
MRFVSVPTPISRRCARQEKTRVRWPAATSWEIIETLSDVTIESSLRLSMNSNGLDGSFAAQR